MKIDKRLNLVIPIYDEAGKVPSMYAHSTAVEMDIWDKYWEPVSMAFTRIMGGGHGILGGPRVADKILRQAAEELRIWDTKDGVANGFVAEIHRRTNVLIPSESGAGWETVPYDEAVKTKRIEPEDAGEIEGALAFFTLVSLMHRRTVRKQILESAMDLWGAQVTLLNCTEYTTSLKTLTEEGSTGGTVAGS